MTTKDNFRKRKGDIEEAYKLLSFILSFEPHRQKPLRNTTCEIEIIITQEIQCVLKAQFLLVLYNMIESTVCDCLNSIYDAITDDELEFRHLSDYLKNIWKKHLKQKKSQNAHKTDSKLEHMKIHFEVSEVKISGNLDLRRIITIFNEHGLQLDTSKREAIGWSFLTVKKKRNLLAHGNISFSYCGSNYILSELNKYQNDIINYMEEVVNKTCSYIENKEYRIGNYTSKRSL